MEKLFLVRGLGCKRLLGVILAVGVWFTLAQAQEQAPPLVLIQIAPLGDVDSDLTGWIAHNLTRAFGIRTVVGPLVPLPKEPYNSSRKQYDADRLAASLVPEFKGMVWRILGVTNQDLYAEGMDFVFGSASPALGVAVVSLARLDDAYYGLPQNPARFRSRAIKESVRFAGLSMGMKPLDDPQCPLSPSRKIEDIDRKMTRFCPPSLEHLVKTLEALRRMPVQ